MDWRDLNRDGKVDFLEEMIAEEMMCSSREEHIALFGDPGEWDDNSTEDDDWDWDDED